MDYLTLRKDGKEVELATEDNQDTLFKIYTEILKKDFGIKIEVEYATDQIDQTSACPKPAFEVECNVCVKRFSGETQEIAEKLLAEHRESDHRIVAKPEAAPAGDKSADKDKEEAKAERKMPKWFAQATKGKSVAWFDDGDGKNVRLIALTGVGTMVIANDVMAALLSLERVDAISVARILQRKNAHAIIIRYLHERYPDRYEVEAIPVMSSLQPGGKPKAYRVELKKKGEVVAFSEWKVQQAAKQADAAAPQAESHMGVEPPQPDKIQWKVDLAAEDIPVPKDLIIQAGKDYMVYCKRHHMSEHDGEQGTCDPKKVREEGKKCSVIKRIYWEAARAKCSPAKSGQTELIEIEGGG